MVTHEQRQKIKEEIIDNLPAEGYTSTELKEFIRRVYDFTPRTSEDYVMIINSHRVREKADKFFKK
jgi:DNA-directed RNA polymerase specialized sigma54-like protein